VGVIFSVNDTDGETRPKKDAPVSALIRHFRYIADLIGPEYVAFGSDFDGTTISSEIRDVTGLPKVIKLLSEAGFSDHDLEKICYKNWLRVLEHTWK
jgi:membrane dipeptidase